MFKLQVVLVPPSAQNGLLPYGLASSTAESSQLLGVNPLTSSRNPDSTLPYAPSGNASALVSHHFSTRMRKFLHFTKSASTLLELSAEIVEKCNKMYPYVDEIEVLSLQDSQGCDLDPDFLVKDVFTMDNIVRAIVRNELEIDDSSPVSSYRAAKRKRLNNGSVQSSSVSGVLNIAKKRPAAFAMRQPPQPPPSQTGNNNNNMRVSTPLAHQIYPPPSESGQVRMDSNNSEDEDEGQGERSFLPPPAQPQSPPIRVSSGIDQSKKIKTATEDDTVSRSETVDPDKLRQQRLLSGTPVRAAMTPNRVTLTGQRVVSENQPGHLSNPYFNRKPSSSATRVTSGRLSIPEPKISEIEKELKEGPSSPSSVLPPKPDRIPMKKPLQETEAQRSEGELDGEEEDEEEEEGEEAGSDESEKKVRQFIQRQTSIADNNGSPTKNSPLAEENVHLAELPQARPSSEQSQLQRKTSLEARVEHKSSSGGNLADEERIRIDNFSENEDEGVNEKEHDKQLEGQLDRVKHQVGASNAEALPQTATQDVDDNDSDNETANDTVVVRDNRSKSSGNHSINREELLRFMEGDNWPTWNRQSSKKKPYTTVLHKDIDNSKPDPRNILPEKMTRSAAKRAAQLLSGNTDESSDSEPGREIEESSSDDGSSDVESDALMEDEDDDKVAVTENNSVKMLNIHPLKETVIKMDQKSGQQEDSEQSEGTSFGSSSDHEQDDQPVKDHAGEIEAPKIVVQNPNMLNADSDTSQHISTSGKPSAEQPEKFSATNSSPQGATLSRFRAQFLNSEKELPKSSPASLSSVNHNGLKQFKPDSSPASLRREATDPKSLEMAKGASFEDARRLKEFSKQVDLKAKQRASNESKTTREQAETQKRQEKEEKARLKQQEAERKKQEAELRRKKEQEDLERLKEQQFRRQQEELERKKREYYEKTKQEELERQKRDEENKRREEENRRKEAEAEKKRLETLENQKQEEIKKKQEEEKKKKEQGEKEKLEQKKQAELEKKRQQEELEETRQREELEKKKQAELEKKRQQEELEETRQREELEKKKQEELEHKREQEELEKKRQQEGLEKKKEQEEHERRRQQEEITRKKQLEELNRKNQQEEAERKRKEKDQQEKKRQDERSRKQEELQKKKQAESEKKKQQQQELQKKKQAELDMKKEQSMKNKAKSSSSSSKSTISKPAAAKSPAIANGSDKLKELKARFTSPKNYVPTSAKNSQQDNKDSESEESDPSDDESSTEYSSSSSEDEDESSSKKSRRMVVNTPKGSVTSGSQKSASKKALPQDSIEAAPQSTQRSNVSSQRSQSEAPTSTMASSPEKSQADSGGNSSILDGLPKKVRPSLSSLSDLASRGVPEVREKGASLSPPPQVTKASAAKKIDSDSDNDDSDNDDSEDNDASDTESESEDSDSDDSDSESSGFISAKTAGSALGKKKKGGGGFASLLRDSQRR